MGKLALACLIFALGCDGGPLVRIPSGQTYASLGGAEVFVPDSDTAHLAEILARIDSIGVERYPPAEYTHPPAKPYPAWSAELRGLPPGWSWVLMGEGPFRLEGQLVTGYADCGSRRVFASTVLLEGAHFETHGAIYVPAGEHEAAHAWTGCWSGLHGQEGSP